MRSHRGRDRGGARRLRLAHQRERAAHARPASRRSSSRSARSGRRARTGIPEFARTPAFAWAPIRGAKRYEFELSTSPATSDAGFAAANGLVWSSSVLQTPATAIPIALPWITGEPASLYWHVRAVAGKKVSGVERDPGVQHALGRRAEAADRSRSRATSAGRRSTAPRATRSGGSSAGKVIATMTNVADEREFYAFHDDAGLDRRRRLARPRRPRDLRPVQERAAGRLVRAVEPGLPLGRTRPTRSRRGTDVMPVGTDSDVVSDARSRACTASCRRSSSRATATRTTACTASTSSATATASTSSSAARSSAGPAYAPRTTGPLQLPASAEELADAPAHVPGRRRARATRTQPTPTR